MADIVWKEKVKELCDYFMNTILCTPIRKIFCLWKKKLTEKNQLIKSLIQEPPMSKDCLRINHFHFWCDYLSKIIDKKKPSLLEKKYFCLKNGTLINKGLIWTKMKFWFFADNVFYVASLWRHFVNWECLVLKMTNFIYLFGFMFVISG